MIKTKSKDIKISFLNESKKSKSEKSIIRNHLKNWLTKPKFKVNNRINQAYKKFTRESIKWEIMVIYKSKDFNTIVLSKVKITITNKVY